MIRHKRVFSVAILLVATFFGFEDGPAPLSATMVKSDALDIVAITGGTLINGSGRAPVNEDVQTLLGA